MPGPEFQCTSCPVATPLAVLSTVLDLTAVLTPKLSQGPFLDDPGSSTPQHAAPYALDRYHSGWCGVRRSHGAVSRLVLDLPCLDGTPALHNRGAARWSLILTLQRVQVAVLGMPLRIAIDLIGTKDFFLTPPKLLATTLLWDCR